MSSSYNVSSKKLKTVELFCGTKSFSKVAEMSGHETFTVDIEEKHKPDLVIDIMELSLSVLPERIDVLWASPPCNSFSVASIYRHWDNGNPKSDGAIIGRAMLYKTLWLIMKLQPKYFFIENPRGMMRKESIWQWLENKGVELVMSLKKTIFARNADKHYYCYICDEVNTTWNKK